MKATKIYYQKCFNLGNYRNEVIGVELEVEANEKASDVMEMARHFVNSESVSTSKNETYRRMKRIFVNPNDYTDKQIKEACKFLEKNAGEFELPF